MASLSQMEIGSSLVKYPSIELHKSFLGLKKTLVYSPTSEKISLETYEYTPDKSSKIEQILKADNSTLQQVVEKTGEIEKAATSNLRLELAFSEKQSFAAVQLFRFVDFQYQPVTEIRYYEGDSAKLIAKAFM